MKTQNASDIKEEIDQISSRIDSIIKTVKKFYPIAESRRDADLEADAESRQETSDCHLKQKPDQEA